MSNTIPDTNDKPKPGDVLCKLAAANPGTCGCGHRSDVHGFGSGECWTCAWDDDRQDCDRFDTQDGAAQ